MMKIFHLESLSCFETGNIGTLALIPWQYGSSCWYLVCSCLLDRPLEYSLAATNSSDTSDSSPLVAQCLGPQKSLSLPSLSPLSSLLEGKNQSLIFYMISDIAIDHLECLKPFPEDPDDSAGDKEYGSSSDETR